MIKTYHTHIYKMFDLNSVSYVCFHSVKTIEGDVGIIMQNLVSCVSYR